MIRCRLVSLCSSLRRCSSRAVGGAELLSISDMPPSLKRHLPTAHSSFCSASRVVTGRRTESSSGRRAPPLPGCGCGHAKPATDDVGTSPNLAIQPLQGFRGLDRPAVPLGEVQGGEAVVLGAANDSRRVRMAGGQQVDGARGGLPAAGPGGLLEDGVHGGRGGARGRGRQPAWHVAEALFISGCTALPTAVTSFSSTCRSAPTSTPRRNSPHPAESTLPSTSSSSSFSLVIGSGLCRWCGRRKSQRLWTG